MHAEDMTHVGFVCCFSLYDLSVLNLEELVFLVSLFPLIPSGSYIGSTFSIQRGSLISEKVLMETSNLEVCVFQGLSFCLMAVGLCVCPHLLQEKKKLF